ncbi:unnamed protein product [Orchesella dallaii]|uniref:F-box domain-containing protein n=1 Tax=Orchesella dallaii TaxID=48710 RepID=A0ABP1RT70_9HEXA
MVGIKENRPYHPFLNKVVLKHFFAFCSIPELAKCRLVCKTWERDAQPIWRERATVQIVPTIFTDEAEILNIKFRPSTFQRYALKGQSLRSDSDWMILFWSSCKNWLIHLQIKNCTIGHLSKGTLQDLLYRCTTNLKTLEIENFYIVRDNRPNRREQEQTERFISFEDITDEQRNLKTLVLGISDRDLPLTIYDILKLYPCLEHLRLYSTSSSRYTGSFVPLLFETILKIRKESNCLKLNLKTLDSIATSNGQELREGIYESGRIAELKEMKLPLECLTIELGRDTTFEISQQIFSLYAKTLRKLDVFRPSGSTPFPSFPSKFPLRFLSVLRMQENMCKDMSFLKLMPNLRILHICELESASSNKLASEIISATKENEMNGFTNGSLKEFRFDYSCEADELKRLIGWFPNVQKLVIKLSTETLKIVCEGWPSLVEMGLIHPTKVSNSNIDINLGMLHELKYLTHFYFIQDLSQLNYLMNNTGFHPYLKNGNFPF